MCVLKTSVLWASVIAKQTCRAILFYISVSSMNLKALWKAREVLLLLFEVDGSYFTDVVTTPQVPLRQQKCFLSAALSIKRITPVMHLDQDTQTG